jgi:hypothetical protein
MGNTVSAAEITAAHIVGSTEPDFAPGHRRTLHGNASPACPMHKKEVIIISVIIIVMALFVIFNNRLMDLYCCVLRVVL